MTQPTYIQPAFIDHLAILDELRAMGWLDYKIEAACDFAQGYVAAVRSKRVTNLAYFRAVRLHNLWVGEVERMQHADIRLSAVTT